MTKPIDPYQSGKFTYNPYAKKNTVEGSVVVVLDGRMEDRGLQLISPISRCVKTDEVHELILTDEQDVRPGSSVNRIAYLGFFSVSHSGVIIAGDEVSVNGRCIGYLAGFDETHMPNHLNIVIKAERLITGVSGGIELNDQVKFKLVK